MDISLYPKVLYRIPRFAMSAALADSWEELRGAIALSSPGFFALIRDIKSTELDNLPENIQHTIWKYFNRAKYRATPYATFAGVGLCGLKPGADSNLTIQADQQRNNYIDWPHKDEVVISAIDIAQENLVLFANSSYYVVKDAIRYISFVDGQFELSDIDYYETVIVLLQSCTTPIAYQDLLKALDEKGHHLDEPIGFIDQLLELQLIMSERHPNIIGEDYFQRIGISADQHSDSYILAERKLIAGDLNPNLFRDFNKLITILQQLVPAFENTPLRQFASNLEKRFGNDQVPLMQALDPETGIGYDDLAQAAETEDLLARFASNRGKKTENNELRQMLLKNLSQNSPDNTVLQLEDLPLKANKHLLPLPNTFSALVSVADNLICIDSLGGCTATSLMGRFTLVGKPIAQTCCDLALIEQEANPAVLFFDVAYIAEKTVDNVSRRKQIYPFQLSILNFDTSDAPLTMDDITISARGSELILWSKHYDKRLVPRLSSAYNYTRSDLSVFRLLCDMQSQGLQANLSLKLQAILPDAGFYPRLQYRNFVVSPAKWKLDAKDAGTDLSAYLKQLGVGRYFKAGSGDQTLSFDQLEPGDMKAFSLYLKKNKSTYIEEAFLPEHSCVHDHENRPYHAQFLLSFTHRQDIYRTALGRSTPLETHKDIQQVIPPGRDWLYFEIYCHPIRSDQLLAGPVSTFLNEYRAQIETWFFIRYSENGEHIRLRVQLKNISNGYLLITALSDLLAEDLDSGVVSDLMLKSYKRETARYGWGTMTAIEAHFSTDSEYILSLIPSRLAANDKYRLVIDVALSMKGAGVFDQAELKLISEKSSDTFCSEHQIETDGFRELNAAYKNFREQIVPVLTHEQQQARELFRQSLIANLLNTAQNQKRILFADLIHMHVNRLFDSKQRTHEMMIYYFLNKELQRERAIAANKRFV